MNTTSGSFIQSGGFHALASPYWGDEMTRQGLARRREPANRMIDQDGRVWLTARIRNPATPAYCRKGSDLPSAKVFPMDNAGRQAALYDPKADKLTYIDLCFTTHHMAFAEDADDTLWFSAGGARAPGDRLAQHLRSSSGDLATRCCLAGLGAVHSRHQR